ncbi:MAG: glycoside hydrolase family 3 N-terminal domain-containing protein [Bacteroides intestinalis]
MVFRYRAKIVRLHLSLFGTLRERSILLRFSKGIKAGALSVMVNSAMNNGLPFHANYVLVTQWLKEDLNWDGMIVTDWADINNLYTRDKDPRKQERTRLKWLLMLVLICL